jgi:nitrous oxide reductase
LFGLLNFLSCVYFVKAQGSNISSFPTNETKTNVTGTTTATAYNSNQTRGKRILCFYNRNSDVDGKKLKVAGDSFSITTMIVNKGDKVTVHFYDVDPAVEKHSFTIGAPYNIDKNINTGESATATFTADHEGIF